MISKDDWSDTSKLNRKK